jgi:ribosomal protein S17E
MAIDKIQAYKKLRRRVAGYAGSFTTKLRRSLVSRNNVASSELINSVKGRVTKGFDDNGNLIAGFEVMLKGYGRFLNKNIHPKKMPPVDAIMRWMDLKGIKPGRDNKGRFMKKKQAAYLIARSIQKRGFKTYNDHGIGWLDIVWNEEKLKLRNLARKDLLQAVKGLSQESLSFSRESSGEVKTFFK